MSINVLVDVTEPRENYFLHLCYNLSEGVQKICVFATSYYNKPYPTISKIRCMTEKLLKYY